MYNNQKIIALCITELNDEDIFSFVAALNNTINDFGYRLFVYHSHADFYKRRKNEAGNKAVFDLIHFNVVDAIIIYEMSVRNYKISDEIIMNAKLHNIPFITIGDRREGDVNFILDYEVGFEKVLRHIIEYHRIKDTLMIAGRKDSAYSNRRINTYKKVLSENQIEFKESMVRYGNYTSEPTIKVVQDIIDRGNVPKAVICANDQMAIAALDTLKKNGFSIPEDIAVTGYDGIRDTRYSNPPITTCRTDYKKMARDLVLSVNRLLDGEAITDEFYTDQILEIYSSCGCDISSNTEFGSLLKVVRDRHKRFLFYNENFHKMTEHILSLRTPKEISQTLRQYNLHNSYIVLNDTFFDEGVNPANDKRENSFSDHLFLLFKSNGDLHDYPKTFKKEEVLPDICKMLEGEDPIVFVSLSTGDLPIGFLCVDYKMDIEEYNILPQCTIFLSKALSDYRNIRYLEDLTSRYGKLAEEDSMTGLLNRTGFYSRIDELQGEMLDTSLKKFLVALVDLDGLKGINDNYGHLAGDRAIITIANIIKTIPLENKICVRYGGDEFLICTLCEDEKEAKSIIEEHILRHIQIPNDYSGDAPKLSVSMGFGSSQKGEVDIDNLLRKSDELMYKNKMAKRRKRTTG